jgi:FlaA1/EpsC-like NDP-sugar epimerase
MTPSASLTPISDSGGGSPAPMPLESINHHREWKILEERGPMIRVLILGAGGHARVIADATLNRFMKSEGIDVVGFLDDNPD